MKITNLAPAERSLEIRVGPQEEDVVNVTYRPGALTLDIADKLKALQDDPLADLTAAEIFLLPLITRWDLQSDDGEELPANAETLKMLPIEFVGRVFTAIRADALPDPQTPAISENGSPQEAREEGSLSGTGS